MSASLAILGALCVLLGLFPAPVVQAALAALAGVPGAALYGAGTVTGADVMGAALGGSGYQPLMVALALLLCGVLVWLIRRLATSTGAAHRARFGGEYRLPGQRGPLRGRAPVQALPRPLGCPVAALVAADLPRAAGLERAIRRRPLGCSVRSTPVHRALAGLPAGGTAAGRGTTSAGRCWPTAPLIAVLIGMEGGLR